MSRRDPLLHFGSIVAALLVAALAFMECKRVPPGAGDAGPCTPEEEIPYDGIDQDCDGADLVDVDKDGFIAKEAAGRDCDDTNALVKPGGVEVCGDGIDQDCSGQDLRCSGEDRDGDGFAPNAGDCDDDDRAVHPDAEEIPYNGKDDDCDVATKEDDLDGDGYAKRGAGDCDDEDAKIFPGADEIPYDGIDQDCSGSDLTDYDRDGVPAAEAGGTDCDDKNPTIKPGAVEVCGDGIDQDCVDGDLPCADQGVPDSVPHVCGNGSCESSESGVVCAQDCCDANTPCDQTKQFNGVLYCRSMNGGPYEWITVTAIDDVCDEAHELNATASECEGVVSCCTSLPGGYTPGPCP